jgi:hypothetical protein
MAGVPQEYTDFYLRLGDRKTILLFDDFTSLPREVLVGLIQGCPSSVIAYPLYSRGLANVPKSSKKESGAGFVDDNMIMVEARDPKEANKKLKKMMTRANGMMEWSKSHDSEFELTKSAHMIFTRRRSKTPNGPTKTAPIPRPKLSINGINIPTVRSFKLLGIILDDELRFKEHAAHAIAKGTKWINMYRRLATPTIGAKPTHAARYYKAVALPRILYGASLFLTPWTPNSKRRDGNVTQLTKVQ